MVNEKLKHEILEQIKDAQKVIIGIGPEWQLHCTQGRDLRQCCLGDEGQEEIKKAYACLYELVKEKDYFVVTTVTDGAVYDAGFDRERITAPCGNVHWRQCSKACTKDIWEEGEVPDDICPHCKAPLTGNTIKAEKYIEEGYLPSWRAYTKWQTGTLNRKLVILELGEGFLTPTVMRWPFEKIVFFNQKSQLYRVHESLCQIPDEVRERAVGIKEPSLRFILDFTTLI